MRLPLDGDPRRSSDFKTKGMGSLGYHLGIDWAVPVGTPVKAPGSGVVTSVSYGRSGGKAVELRIGGYLWRFLHLNEQLVRAGQTVIEGQVIAKSGKTGQVSGPHLHADTRVDGTKWNASIANYRDPRFVIDEANRKISLRNPKAVYLKPHVEKWAFYKVGTPLPLKRVNRAGELSPKKWGGLTYHNPTWVAENALEVTSPSLGKIWIYVDGDAEIRY